MRRNVLLGLAATAGTLTGCSVLGIADKGKAPAANVLAAPPVTIQTPPPATPTPPPDDTAAVVAYLRWLQQFEAQRETSAAAQDTAARQALRTANPIAVREAFEKAAVERKEWISTFEGHPPPIPCQQLAATYDGFLQYEKGLLQQTEDITVHTAQSDREGNMVSAQTYQDQVIALAKQDAEQSLSYRRALERDLGALQVAFPKAPAYVFGLFPDQTQPAP